MSVTHHSEEENSSVVLSVTLRSADEHDSDPILQKSRLILALLNDASLVQSLTSMWSPCSQLSIVSDVLAN